MVYDLRIPPGADLAAGDYRILETAITNGDADLVKYLVHCGCSPNATLGNAKSAMQHAASQSSHVICKWLFSKGGDPGVHSDEDSAIAIARRSGHHQVHNPL